MACKTLTPGERQQQVQKIERLKNQAWDFSILLDDLRREAERSSADYRTEIDSTERHLHATVDELTRILAEHDAMEGA